MANTVKVAGVELTQSHAFISHRAQGYRSLLRTGGAFAVVGAVLALVSNGFHPHPDDFHLQALLLEIEQNNLWPLLHLLLIFALLLIFGALLSLTLTCEEGLSGTISRFAALATGLGGALIMVSTAMDGFSMKALAHSWNQATIEEKTMAFRVAEAFENAQYAIYSLSVILFLGIGIFLYGLATTLNRIYPRVLGWLAMVSGAGAFAVGVVQIFGGPSFRDSEIFFVLFSIMSTIWIFLMGVLMWRKAGTEQPNKSIA
jgi:hypothetical protein